MKDNKQIPAHIIAAQICLVIAVLWAIIFLTSMKLGAQQNSQISLLEFVLLGDIPDLFSIGIINTYSSYALSIIVIRGFIVFSVGWPVLTRMVHSIQKVYSAEDDFS